MARISRAFMMSILSGKNLRVLFLSWRTVATDKQFSGISFKSSLTCYKDFGSSFPWLEMASTTLEKVSGSVSSLFSFWTFSNMASQISWLSSLEICYWSSIQINSVISKMLRQFTTRSRIVFWVPLESWFRSFLMRFLINWSFPNIGKCFTSFITNFYDFESSWSRRPGTLCFRVFKLSLR